MFLKSLVAIASVLYVVDTVFEVLHSRERNNDEKLNQKTTPIRLAS